MFHDFDSITHAKKNANNDSSYKRLQDFKLKNKMEDDQDLKVISPGDVVEIIKYRKPNSSQLKYGIYSRIKLKKKVNPSVGTICYVDATFINSKQTLKAICYDNNEMFYNVPISYCKKIEVDNDQKQALKESMKFCKINEQKKGYCCLLKILVNREKSIFCKEVLGNKTFYLPKQLFPETNFEEINRSIILSIPEWMAATKGLI